MKEESRLVLYIDESQLSEEAQKMLRGAGFDIQVRTAPNHYRAIYGTPVLFGLFNKFEGLEGIRVFLENAVPLSIGRRNGTTS
jgi:hypothetical protein